MLHIIYCARCQHGEICPDLSCFGLADTFRALFFAEWTLWQRHLRKSWLRLYLKAASPSASTRLQSHWTCKSTELDRTFHRLHAPLYVYTRNTDSLIIFFCRDPDNVVLCLLATDEDDQDVALQIHFTLIQAFCCENDINILRVNNMGRLAEILEGVKPIGGEPIDLHCVLVTVRCHSLHAFTHKKSTRCIPFSILFSI